MDQVFTCSICDFFKKKSKKNTHIRVDHHSKKHENKIAKLNKKYSKYKNYSLKYNKTRKFTNKFSLK